MHTIQLLGFLVAYSCHYEMTVHASGACTFVAASYMITSGKILQAKPWNNDFQKLANYFSKSGTPKTRFFAKVFFAYTLISCVFWSWVRLSF